VRYTLIDAITVPGNKLDNLVSWWLDWPWRRLYDWKMLLFEKGQGWLRWKSEERTEYSQWEPPELYVVFPPAQRIYWWLRSGCRNWDGWWNTLREKNRRYFW